MDIKKMLNEEELEKITGGAVGEWKWHSTCCNRSSGCRVKIRDLPLNAPDAVKY